MTTNASLSCNTIQFGSVSRMETAPAFTFGKHLMVGIMGKLHRRCRFRCQCGLFSKTRDSPDRIDWSTSSGPCLRPVVVAG